MVLAAGCYHGLDAATGEAVTEASGTGGATGNVSGNASADTGASTGEDSGGNSGPPLPAQPLHRLNRLEYNNTVRDLLGTGLRPADAFGPDPEANGFDNMAAQLHVSVALLDAHEKAAREVVDDALDAVPAFRVRFTGDALTVPGGYPVGELWALSGKVLAVEVTVPHDTEAELVLDAGASVGGGAPAPEALLRLDGVDLPGFVVQGSAAIPAAHVQAITLTAGAHTIEVVPTNHVNLAAENIFNNVFVAALTVRSLDLVPGPGRGLVYRCEPTGPEDLPCYEEILRTFAARAWRRPLAPAEADGLIDLWTQLQVQGESDADALRLALRAVLLSPKFLYRARTVTDADADGWLDDYVLASRLSYFLWSSMPDDRLFAMAAEGKLASDEGLSEAVAFMLTDEKAVALLDGFAEQWLSTRHLARYNPSPEAFPGFDEVVRAAMTAESRLFFGDFLLNELPVTDLILPDFTYRNDPLAVHYGRPPVGSSELVRIPAAGDERRGLLALGAWLTATSEADHSSPIRRGLWVSDRLLCTPVPPPPPGVMFEPPELGEEETVREALERHRSESTCAGCHALLDVLGMGFEEYNGIAQPVLVADLDNLGQLPDGRLFEGAAELSELYADSQVFVGCLTRKLFTYATGRAPSFFDSAYLDPIAAAATAEQHGLVQLIDAIVHTPAFRSPAPLVQGE